MANVNAPRGFVPVRDKGRDPTTNSKASYTIASAYGTAIYQGDPVLSTGTSDTYGRRTVAIGVAGSTHVGVFAGVKYIDSTGKPVEKNYWPAAQVGTNIEALIYDDPETIFEAQVSSATGMVAADTGNGADITLGTGNAATGVSGAMVDQTTLGQDNVVILSLSPKVGNEFGQYAKALVQFKEHEYADPLTKR